MRNSPAIQVWRHRRAAVDRRRPGLRSRRTTYLCRPHSWLPPDLRRRRAAVLQQRTPGAWHSNKQSSSASKVKRRFMYTNGIGPHPLSAADTARCMAWMCRRHSMRPATATKCPPYRNRCLLPGWHSPKPAIPIQNGCQPGLPMICRHAPLWFSARRRNSSMTTVAKFDNVGSTCRRPPASWDR
jgi:hypothetical protein